MLIVKSEQLADPASVIFIECPKLVITTEGERHLGAVVGSDTSIGNTLYKTM